MQKSEVLAKICEKGYSEAEATAQYDSILATAGNADMAGIYQFCKDSFPPEEVDNRFVATQVESLPGKGGSISTDPYRNDMGKTQPSGTEKGTNLTSRQEYSRPMLNSEAENVIKGMLSPGQVDNRTARTRETSIAKLLIQKPNPSTYLLDAKGKPVTVVVEVDADKMETFETQLDQTPENIAAFQEVKAAWKNGTPVPVYVNDKANRRVIGAIVNTMGETRVLTIASIKAFLLTEVLGRIIGRPGVILSKWEEKHTSNANGAISKTTTTLSLKWAGRDTAIEEGKVDFVSLPITAEEAAAQGFDGHLDKGVRVRIDKAFVVSVYSDKAEKDIKRTKRLTGKTDLPRFVLKPEYKGIFPDTKRKDFVEMPATPDEVQKVLDTIDTGLAAIAAGDFTPSAEMIQSNATLSEMVSTIRKASMPSGDGAGQGF